MKKKLLLILSTMCLISPLIASCGTSKPSEIGPNGNNTEQNDNNGGNNNDNNNHGGDDNEGGNDNNDGNENLDPIEGEISVAEALKIGRGLGINEETEVEYICTGKVSTVPNDTYGSFDLEQNGSKVTVWSDKKIWDALEVKYKLDDTVTVKGKITHFKDTKNEKIEFMYPKILRVNGADPMKPAPKKPATASITVKGDGTAKLSRTEGMSGDEVTVNITKGDNVYESITVNGNGVYKMDGKYTFVLVPGENKVEVIFRTVVPGEGHPELFESIEAMTYGTRRGKDYDNHGRVVDLGPVEAYYEPVRGLKGKALKDKLLQICRPQRTYSYDHLKSSFPNTDFDPDDPSNMILMYTGERYSISSFHGWTYINREHVWPNHRGSGTTGAGSDKHMQRPCEQKINSTRSNYDFGIVTNGKELTGTNAGNKVGGSKFEPKKEFKGDTARIIFYIATVYSNFALSRPKDTTRYNYWPNTNEHGVFDDLYQWATNPAIDPVSKFEMSRNNQVDFGYQRNRNPFIDHPEFIEMIYDKNYNGPGALED